MDTQTLIKAFENILRLFECRQEELSIEDIENFRNSIVLPTFWDKTRILKSSNLICLWISCNKLKHDIFLSAVNIITKQGYKSAILICNALNTTSDKILTPNTKQAIDKSCLSETLYLSVYTLSELIICPLDFRFQAKSFRKVSDLEKKEILSKYKANVSNFPKMSRNDPIAKWYGFRIGNLIEIERENLACKGYTSLSYRIVKK